MQRKGPTPLKFKLVVAGALREINGFESCHALGVVATGNGFGSVMLMPGLILEDGFGSVAEAADAPVTWSDEPPVAVDEHSVELEAPPSFDEPPSPEPPPASEEDELRTLLAGTYDGLRSRVPATWHTACATAYQKAIAENGGDLFAMTAGQLRKAMAAIDAYAAKCDQAMQVKH